MSTGELALTKKAARWVAMGGMGVAFPLWLHALPYGPPPGKTGAPGENTCMQCHSGGTGGGRVEIASSAGSIYAPGVAQQLTITVTDADARIYGFELSARAAGDNSQAGTLNPAAGESNMRVICSDGSPRGPNGCPAGAPIEYLEHSAPRQPNTFRVEWTPPPGARGPVTIYVAANAANANFQPTGDDIYAASHTLLPQADGAPPAVSQGGVVDAWSFKSPIGDAAWVALFGSNLSPSSRTWRAAEVVEGKLPISLDGVSVKINNKDAYVYFISPGQINVQSPEDPATGLVPVQVKTPNGTSNIVTVNKQATAPALFTWAGRAPGSERFVGAVSAQLKPDGASDYIAPAGLLPGLTTRAARPGETLLLFATGCGPTVPRFPAGQVVNPPYPRLAGAAGIRAGGIPAQVTGDTGFLIFAGQCQFNVTIPTNAPDGNLPVALDIGGVSTATTQPEITIPVQSQTQGSSALANMQVAYRLDPWLFGGTYGGGVWASPPVLGPTNQGGGTFTLETRVQGLDSRGQPVAVSPRWIASDPAMVTVSPAEGSAVTITVKGAGRSVLRLVFDAVIKELVIKATYQGDALLVEIAQ
jgi:uncharacterized protein (TIGR03437 family)